MACRTVRPDFLRRPFTIDESLFSDEPRANNFVVKFESESQIERPCRIALALPEHLPHSLWRVWVWVQTRVISLDTLSRFKPNLIQPQQAEIVTQNCK